MDNETKEIKVNRHNFRLKWNKYPGIKRIATTVYTSTYKDMEGTVYGWPHTREKAGDWFWYISAIDNISEGFIKSETRFKRSDNARLSCERELIGPLRPKSYKKQKEAILAYSKFDLIKEE